MLNGAAANVVKQSVLYSYVLSQPFTVYVDAYPALQNEQLQEAGNLQFGQHGKSVRVLQQKMNKLAYFDDSIDGEYGVLTEYALKNFQRTHSLNITGEADSSTINAIIDEEKEEYKKQLEEMSGSINPGMKKSDVKIVQRSLDYFGYYRGEVDGIYGPLTQQALETAEKEQDMELVDDNALKTFYEKQAQQKAQEREQEKERKQEEEQQKEKAENQNTDQKSKESSESSKSGQETKQADVTSSNHSKAIEAARAQIGTPYVWGGESPSGFDCSGFIQYSFQMEGISLPRTVSDVWNFTARVDSPSVGDLVFFETYQPGPSHMGIYLGNGKFIHAGESRGVEISKMNNSYWQKRYLGAGRVQ